ncbi:MAG: head decoration protein [Phycisphaerales bacterium]|nr:head decoration protein [Phycisphaerales bacterium]
MENGSVETTVGTNNQQTTNFDNSFIFLRDNKYEGGSTTNDTYDAITLPAGTLMGRVSATGELVPLVSTATDGSQIPVGVLTQSITIEAGDTVSINVCTGGEVAEEKIVLDAGDTLDTVIDGRQLRDKIAADTVGIVLVTGTEMTAFDNQ